MKFYTFVQNNSGGSFAINDDKGIGKYVIIEAESYIEANRRAEEIGLYFDGDGDCPCCGDRWSEQYDESDADDVPSVYGTPLADVERWPAGTSAFIHYCDGRIESVVIGKVDAKHLSSK